MGSSNDCVVVMWCIYGRVMGASCSNSMSINALVVAALVIVVQM